MTWYPSLVTETALRFQGNFYGNEKYLFKLKSPEEKGN